MDVRAVNSYRGSFEQLVTDIGNSLLASDIVARITYLRGGEFVWQGRHYTTFDECCMVLGISREDMHKYLKKEGCTKQEALAYFTQRR